jgi:hypothetical protein
MRRSTVVSLLPQLVFRAQHNKYDSQHNIILSLFRLNVEITLIIVSTITPIFAILSVSMLSIVILSVVNLSLVMLSVVILRVVMLSVVQLSVVIVSAGAPKSVW